MTLILASTSVYRRRLLERLGLPFEVRAPWVDETARSGESPEELVQRLAEAKARAVAALAPEALVIGSDQVAVLDGRVIGKPGGHAEAVAQLRRASGRVVRFVTGVWLVEGRTGRAWGAVVPFQVHFRPLDEGLIERYLRREQPYDCAGSFKSEGLGIVLFQRLEGDDPTALMGLPLIKLVELLAAAGVAVV